MLCLVFVQYIPVLGKAKISNYLLATQFHKSVLSVQPKTILLYVVFSVINMSTEDSLRGSLFSTIVFFFFFFTKFVLIKLVINISEKETFQKPIVTDCKN